MKQLGELVVSDYMTAQETVVDDSAKLTQAIGMMVNGKLAVLPVVKDHEIIGILSIADLIEIGHEIHADISAQTYVNQETQDFLLKMLIEQEDGSLVRDVMTYPVDVVTADSGLVEAAAKLVGKKYHYLPVTNAEGRLVGILGNYDFVRLFADYGASEN